MKIVIVRHGEPNYELDCLTEKGKLEAELLSRELCKHNYRTIYSSPLGRAKETASFTLRKLGREAIVLPWLREFDGKCEKPNRKGIVEYSWDWLPNDWTSRPYFFDKDKWVEAPEFNGTNVRDEWARVKDGFDKLMEDNGYRRNGLLYDAVKPNNDTIILFCHLGVEAIMVSHLLGLSPFVLMHGFAPAPSSVTILASEEREKGVAFFRVLSYGQTGHLYLNNEKPSFACRFCECYDNTNERH